MTEKNYSRSVTTTPTVNLPDTEVTRASAALRKAGVIGATVTLENGSVATYKGGPFQTVEIIGEIAKGS